MPRKTTPEEFAAIRLENLRKGHEAMKARKAVRLAREAEEKARTEAVERKAAEDASREADNLVK